MQTNDQAKTIDRLEARISADIKALLQKAADLEGRSLTDFVVASVYAEACRVIEKHQVMKLNLEDSAAFVEALLNPAEPNDALKAASQDYKKFLELNS